MRGRRRLKEWYTEKSKREAVKEKYMGGIVERVKKKEKKRELERERREILFKSFSSFCD